MTSDDFYNMTEEEMDAFMEEMEREHAPFDVEQTWLLKDFLLKFTQTLIPQHFDLTLFISS